MRTNKREGGSRRSFRKLQWSAQLFLLKSKVPPQNSKIQQSAFLFVKISSLANLFPLKIDYVHDLNFYGIEIAVMKLL